MFALFVVALIVLAKATDAMKFMHMEQANHELRTDFVKRDNAQENTFHEVVIAVKQRNLDQLEKVLFEVSDPTNSKYGKYLTREEVAALTANPAATEKVSKFLQENDVTIVRTAPFGEYITAMASVGTWQKLFATTFYEFDNVDTNKKVLRANHYSVPEDVHEHIETVFNTIHLPPQMSTRPLVQLGANTTAAGSITPALLNSYYHITTNTGNKLASQSLYESLGQYYSPADLATFQKNYNLPADAVDQDIGGYESDSECKTTPNNCAEANLDVQYIMAVSQMTPTTYWYDDSNDAFVSWIKAVSATTNPPLVHSISYGAIEDSLPSTYTTQFNTEAQKLGVQGVTIVASSGDDGVANFQARNAKRKCGYHPSFPASSPYVLAVGATQGPESGTEEIACTSNTGGVITTGGGFSTKFTAPSYQTATISKYFSTLTTSQKPVTGYAATGRGYPDVAMAGLNYNVVIGGKTYQVSGTSASGPVVAGMLSLVNAARLSAGKPAFGFVNQAVYQNGAAITNDVTKGENNCAASSVCCDQGFYATAGWDPLTGFGSVDYAKLYSIFSKL